MVDDDLMGELLALHELLEDPVRWTTNAPWRDEDGKPTDCRSEVCSACIVGGASMVTVSASGDRLVAALSSVSHRWLAGVNDYEGHDSVMALIRRAIEREAERL